MSQAAKSCYEYDASIIIVSFNTREVLRECLDSVICESAGFRIEILIVDNNSSDGSPEMIERDFPQVKLIRSAVNLGFGAANNLALEQAKGRYYVLLNSDAFFQKDALKRAIEHMDEQPGCGLGGSRLIGRDGSWQPSSRSFHSIVRDLVVMTGLAYKFPRSRFFGHFDRTWADRDQPASVDWVPGAFSIIRPSALARTGLFDPAFFLYYEEVDLCRRIKDAGYSIWYWPDVVVVHIGGESSRQLKTTLEISSMAAQVVMWRMRSTLLYYRKHHGPQACMAKWSELTMYRLTVLRNRFSSAPMRRERGEHYRTMIALMNQAWKDTQGGRVSPPRPW
ncbi:MAG: glycosyltransferase family 2 protein [Acidobacteria bacterium]|nr:glycosyltransferase family 2 protein [Acidobacteriota bacterium]